MGVLLRCSPAALPEAGAAFLIVTADLQVSAVSEGAEPVFGTEEDVLGLAIDDLLTSPLGDEILSRSVSRAAVRVSVPATIPACHRRGEEAAAMMAATISTCGPPRAALVTVEASLFGQR